MSGRVSWILQSDRDGDYLGYNIPATGGGTIRLEVPRKLTRLDADRVAALARSVADGVGAWAFPLARAFPDSSRSESEPPARLPSEVEGDDYGPGPWGS